MRNLTLIITILISLNFTASLSANTNTLASTKDLIELNLKELLGPYPAPGSKEEFEDYLEINYYQLNRTEKECNEAAKEATASLENFFGGDHKLLSANEIKKVKRLFALPFIRTGADILLTKKMFNRPRPYEANSNVHPCIPLEKSRAYPSGHAAIARMYAELLGDLFPERADLFLKRANEVAKNRVLGGVHHPSDIEAGKLLGSTLAKAFINEDQFNLARSRF